MLSEFIQDVASRGLGLVFSLSDQSGQTDLANSLLDQLIGGRRQVNQVNEDSKIFEDGVLGKTPTGYVVAALVEFPNLNCFCHPSAVTSPHTKNSVVLRLISINRK